MLAMVAIVYSPPVIVLSLAFGGAAYFMWYQASGRMAERVYRRAEQAGRVNDRQRRTAGADPGRGGFGAGPREDWEGPRQGQRRQARQRGRQQQAQGGQRQRQRRPPQEDSGPSTAESYRILGLDPGADEATVKQAYRQKVKDVHPDTEGGDEERFKKVNAAYERLTD
jgi:hypothetical protein